MRILFVFILVVFFGVRSYAQHEFMQWTSIGAEGTLIKKNLDWMSEVDFRFGEDGLQTFFPQVGLEFKRVKWCKPSLEYRYIIDKNKWGNYKGSHRINANLNIGETIERFKFGARLRYQYSFDQLNAYADYNADFDQAIRVKPSIEYDINDFKLTPKASAEFFYNPTYGPEGRQFKKIRYAIGASVELDGPHKISFKYQLDQYLRDPEKDLRHVLSISYAYKF